MCREDQLAVFAGVAPLAGLVEHVGGDRVDVRVLVSSGQDPHTFDPEPRQVLALNRAHLYFNTHLAFETRLIEKATAQAASLRVVDVLDGVALLPNEEHHGNHAHGEACEHAHFDLHVWLGPPQLRVLAHNVCDALVAADPAHAAVYRARLDDFLEALDAAQGRIAAKLAPYAGRRFFVYHPAFTYFASAFDLEQAAVETGGKSPTPRHVRALVHQAIEERVNVIFVQPQFARHAAAAVAACIGGRVVAVDPLARDVLANLERIAEELAAAFGAADTSRSDYVSEG
ncbi:MAG TPA: zinc ABC transporter substrate-binding protein, partial [Candidatus Hydrogenedentes bacterium]|nr:zinc ABC transporter substrate-binding protein [Candidatus Hydrogenedentota bacterium]